MSKYAVGHESSQNGAWQKAASPLKLVEISDALELAIDTMNVIDGCISNRVTGTMR
jgi:hypothetical protein